MTLAQAQQAFRHSPGRATALAYMDAAIEGWWESRPRDPEYMSDDDFAAAMKEIRDWLMNEPDRTTVLRDPGFRTMTT